MNHSGDANKMVSDTPRTDDQIGYAGSTMSAIRIEFARQLERELNAANESFRKLNIHALDLAARIKRLEEAGDAMAYFYNPFTLTEWHKTKEDKP